MGERVNIRSTWIGDERKKENVIRAFVARGSIATRCARMYGRSLSKEVGLSRA